MKLTKLLMIVGILSLLIAGSAFAWGGPGRGSDMTFEERQEYRAANGCDYSGDRTTNIDIVAEITGKSVDDIRDLCVELREEDKTIGDYLKEQGLYDEFKTKALENFEEKINVAVENNRIDEERAQELLDQVKEKLEDGSFLDGSRSGFNMRGNGFGRGCGSRGRGRYNTNSTNRKTF